MHRKEAILGRFAEYFAEVVDPRRRDGDHDLTEMLFIALLAALCGAKYCTDIEVFGRAKEDLLRTVLVLKNGIPSHDTLQPYLPHARPQVAGEGVPALHGGLCRVGENRRRNRPGRQSAPASLRTRQEPYAADNGDSLGREDPFGARQYSVSWQQRSSRRLGTDRDASAQRLCRDHGCAALPTRYSTIRRMISDGALPAQHHCEGAPWIICLDNLKRKEVHTE